MAGTSSGARVISGACKLGGSYKLGLFVYRYVDLENVELGRYTNYVNNVGYSSLEISSRFGDISHFRGRRGLRVGRVIF